MRKMNCFSITLRIVFLSVFSFLLFSCKKDNMEDTNLPNVTLTICGPWTTCKAVEDLSHKFYEQNKNCTIVYEYVQNYNKSIKTRLENSPDSVDLFFSDGIQKNSNVIEFTEELSSHKDLDLSETNDSLIKNFRLITTDKNEVNFLYVIPIGGEMRGIYVNKTLLKSLNLQVPTNLSEFLNCCEKLKQAGYIPIQGNPGILAQRLLYPYVANIVANAPNYNEIYQKVNKREEGSGELFVKPLKVMYSLVENYYYNYKYVENTFHTFTDNSDEGICRDFFNILSTGKNNEFYKKDDLGSVAFTAGTLAQKNMMQKTKEDYHSKIDFDFILAPVSDEGGFAYISPSKGIAVNKNSEHLDLAIKYMNFIFSKEINKEFSKIFSYIPNTKDSFTEVFENFHVSKDRVSDLGQVTFDFPFYNILDSNLTKISKANNPKYMDQDGNGNKKLYSFDYYMNNFKNDFEIK